MQDAGDVVKSVIVGVLGTVTAGLIFYGLFGRPSPPLALPKDEPVAPKVVPDKKRPLRPWGEP